MSDTLCFVCLCTRSFVPVPGMGVGCSEPQTFTKLLLLLVSSFYNMLVYYPHRSFHSRMFFLCPVCKKAPHSLPGHLRKVCMRNSTEAEIQAVVIDAKKELSEFCHRGRFWEFGNICDILDSTNPLARFVTHSYASLN